MGCKMDCKANRRLASTDELLQMMLQMPDVIFCDKTERHRLAVANRANHVELIRRNARDDAQQVEVVSLPQGNEVAPAGVAVAVAFDPVLLRVAGKGSRAVELCANEALVIVGG